MLTDALLKSRSAAALYAILLRTAVVDLLRMLALCLHYNMKHPQMQGKSTKPTPICRKKSLTERLNSVRSV